MFSRLVRQQYAAAAFACRHAAHVLVQAGGSAAGQARRAAALEMYKGARVSGAGEGQGDV